MSRPISDYVALAFIGKIDDPKDVFSFGGIADFQGSWDELKTEAEKRVGFEISESIIKDCVRALSDCGLIRVSHDQFAGEFVKIYPKKFHDFIESAHSEDARAIAEGDALLPIANPSDFPNAYALITHPVFDDYAALGDDWLRRALAGLRQQITDAGSPSELLSSAEQNLVPASDRLVTLTHNQVEEVESPLTEVIELVEAENGIDGREGLRELVIGRLKAGRELIRAGIFSLQTVQLTLVVALRLLAEKYGELAIGIAAGKLLDLLLKQFGID